MQAEAHFQDPACPTVHVVSTDIKRRLRWSSRALAVESPNPLDATVWDQSLVYVVRRGWEQSDPSPVHHLALLRAMGRPCTWDTDDNRQTRGGNTRASQGFTHFKWSTSQVFVSHSRNTLGGLKLLLCPQHLHGIEVPPRGVVRNRLPYCRCTVCLTVTLRQVQKQSQTL